MINKIKELIHYALNGKQIETKLKQEINQVELTLIDAMKNYEAISTELVETELKYEASKIQIAELLKKETIDILDLKGWYESRRNQNSWFYNGGRLGLVDVRRYLIPSDIKPFTDLANELISKYKLTEDNSPTDIITAMYRYWNLRGSWTYRTDMQLHGKVEWWEDPTEALKKRIGDCETKAKCMMNTATEMLRLLNKSEHEWRLTFIASMVAGEGGHAYLTWLHDDGEYYVVESTYYEVSNYHKTWLRTPMRFNNMYQDPWGFATKTRSWVGSNEALLSFRDPETKI
jgi:hypothetical protein